MIDPALYQKYPKEQVDQAVAYLSYKDAQELPKEESDTLPTIYIFRHGQSEDNANFVFSGWRDSELTAKGRDQALILADKLKTKKLHVLISSEQKRAIETMKLGVSKNATAKNLEIHLDPRIKERSYGVLQGTSKIELQLKDPKYAEQVRRSFLTKATDGESLEEVCERVAKFCEEIVPLMKEFNVNVAVSCHGNSIRGFRRYFEGLTDDQTCKVETMLGQDYAAYVIR